jgi:acetyl-CoA acetyltransferase
MTDAVIVSTARTPIGRAFRGAFNMTDGGDMGGHVMAEEVGTRTIIIGTIVRGFREVLASYELDGANHLFSGQHIKNQQ